MGHRMEPQHELDDWLQAWRLPDKAHSLGVRGQHGSEHRQPVSSNVVSLERYRREKNKHVPGVVPNSR